MSAPRPGGGGIVHASFGRSLQIVSFVGNLTADQSTAFGPFNIEGYRQIRYQARADQSAAANGVVVDQTMNGTDYDLISAATGAVTPPSAGAGYSVVADVVGQGARIRFVNSNSPHGADALRIVAYLYP